MDERGIDWEWWRSFRAVMAGGSLSAAARRLGATQPTVGRQIALLEAAVGEALFTRSSSGLEPTDLARALSHHVEAMAMQAEALARTASASPEAAAGTVRISASEIVGLEVLPGLLAPLLADHPAIAVELDLSNRNADLLNRDADIALRMGRPTQAALVARKLADVGIGLYAHRAYLDRFGTPESAEALASHRLIGADRDLALLRGLTLGGRPITAATFGFRTDSDAAQLGCLRAGIGIGVCQDAIARGDPALVAILPDQVRFDLDIWIVFHEDLRLSRRIRLVADHLAASIPAFYGSARR